MSRDAIKSDVVKFAGWWCEYGNNIQTKWPSSYDRTQIRDEATHDKRCGTNSVVEADATRIRFATRQDISMTKSKKLCTWANLELSWRSKPGSRSSRLQDQFSRRYPGRHRQAGDGRLHAFVNRCAHRGATVQRQPSGSTEHRCVYHQWCYDSAGGLTGVPYRRGIQGVGGYPADFNGRSECKDAQVASHKGVIFGTLDSAPPPTVPRRPVGQGAIDRLFSRPIKVLVMCGGGLTTRKLYAKVP